MLEGTQQKLQQNKLNFITAAKEGNIEQMQILLDSGIDLETIDDEYHATALNFAAGFGKKEAVKWLISKNANPNHIDKDVNTPLLNALHYEHFEIARILLELKHDLDQANKEGITARQLMSQEHIALYFANELNEAGEAFIRAAATGDIKSLQEILDKNRTDLEGPSCINYEDVVYHSTPLAWACEAEQTDAVAFLLTLTPKIHHRDLLGYTPIMYAKRAENAEIVAMLKKAGAYDWEYHVDFIKPVDQKCNVENVALNVENNDQNPLIVAVCEKNYTRVKCLLKQSPELLTKDVFRKAVYYNDFAMCKLLLQTQSLNENMIRKELNNMTNAIAQQNLPFDHDGNKIPYCLSEIFLNFLRRNFSTQPPFFLERTDPHSLVKCYEHLFGKKEDMSIGHEISKEHALKLAMTHAFQLLNTPVDCVVYLNMLNTALLQEWKLLTGQNSIPVINPNHFEFFVHEGERMRWIRPNKEYKEHHIKLKKHSVLQRTLLKAFQKVGMGNVQYKYTGYVSKKIAKKHLVENPFITEGMTSITGLTHGKTSHNIQRFILLKAIEAGKIPVAYLNNDVAHKISIIEFFSAFMTLKDHENKLVWLKILDAGYNGVSFSHPQRLHSVLLTDPAFKNTALQTCLQYTFLQKYMQAMGIWNIQHYNRTYSEIKTFSREIIKEDTTKFMLNTFLVAYETRNKDKQIRSQEIILGSNVDGQSDYYVQKKSYSITTPPYTLGIEIEATLEVLKQLIIEDVSGNKDKMEARMTALSQLASTQTLSRLGKQQLSWCIEGFEQVFAKDTCPLKRKVALILGERFRQIFANVLSVHALQRLCTQRSESNGIFNQFLPVSTRNRDDVSRLNNFWHIAALKNLKAHGLTPDMLLSFNINDTFDKHHCYALMRLVDNGFTVQQAFAEIAGLSGRQVQGIENGLMRDDVIRLNNFWHIVALENLKVHGLTPDMLLSFNTNDTFDQYHCFALMRLVIDNGFTVQQAFAEIAGLSSLQVQGIENGLMRDDVIRLNNFWHIASLKKLKAHGLTPDMLLSFNSGKDEFGYDHWVALPKLVLKRYFSIQKALGEIEGLSLSQIHEIKKGATRRRVLNEESDGVSIASKR